MSDIFGRAREDRDAQNANAARSEDTLRIQIDELANESIRELQRAGIRPVPVLKPRVFRTTQVATAWVLGEPSFVNGFDDTPDFWTADWVLFDTGKFSLYEHITVSRDTKRGLVTRYRFGGGDWGYGPKVVISVVANQAKAEHYLYAPRQHILLNADRKAVFVDQPNPYSDERVTVLLEAHVARLVVDLIDANL